MRRRTDGVMLEDDEDDDDSEITELACELADDDWTGAAGAAGVLELEDTTGAAGCGVGADAILDVELLPDPFATADNELAVDAAEAAACLASSLATCSAMFFRSKL